jgi:hypothetical protein
MSVRPPPDLTPAQFFETWLPSQMTRGPDKPIAVRVRLEGEGGGVWNLRLGPSGLQVTLAGDGGEPDVTIVQTAQDFRAIAFGEPGALNLAPPQSSPTDLLFLDAAAQQIVAQVKGTIRFEVTGYNARTWALAVKLGPGPVPATPDAVISVDAESYAAMLARVLPPAAAYFQGKVKISGDANLAMQLGMALMPRFS